MQIITRLILLFSSVITIISPSNAKVISKPNISHCPNGYILVPANAEFKTNEFCVMKYDAKCSNTDPKCVTSEGVYKNDDPKCTCENNFKVVSSPEGSPITFIPEDDGTNTSATKYCEAANSHLITNAEWMSIARNVEQVSANWCNKDGSECNNPPGTIGKILANGHNDSKPNKALPAGPDNEPNYLADQKRTLELSNGQIIWDLAGNVWQWVDFTVARKDEPESNNPNNKYAKWIWEEFQSVDYDPNTMPSNPKWNSTQGVGRIFHYSYVGDTDTTLYTNIRGGNWRHGYDSGAFTSHFQPVPSKTGIDDVGFRCVTSPK